MSFFLGHILLFGGNKVPKGWARCDGSELPIGEHQALFSLLGTTYGGDGKRTFKLPDLRGRVPIGMGKTTNSSYKPGETNGLEKVQLTIDNLPSHSHEAILNAVSAPITNTPDPTDAFLATDKVTNSKPFYLGADSRVVMNPRSLKVGTTGLHQPHENMQPYLALHFIIAISGDFPLWF